MSKKNKFILWCVLVAVTSFWMWVSAKSWLAGSLFDQSRLGSFGMLSILLIVLISLLSLGFIFFKGKKEGIILSAIVGLMYFVLFGTSNLGLVAVTILIFLFIQSDDSVSGEMLERIKMNSRILIRKSLTNLVLGLFILISFAAYESPAIEDFKNIERLPSSSEVFIETVVEQTLEAQLADTNAGQKELVLNEVTRRTIEQANSFLKPYFQYAPPALAFGLFLILWGVGWIFIWLSVFLGMLIFQILQKSHFFRIEERDVKAQGIVI